LKTRLLILLTVAAVGVAAQPLPCPPPQSTNQEVLSFEQAVTGVVHVRVYNERGELLEGYDYDASHPKKRDRSFYPETRFVATTASAGCVRGEARRPPSSPCVAWFQLPLSLGPPLDSIVVEAPEETVKGMEARLQVKATSNHIQCTIKHVLEPGDTITNIINGEQVLLTVRGLKGGSPFMYVYSVDTKALRKNKKDQPPTRILTDALSGTQKDSGQGRGAPSENQLLAAANHIAVKVSVPK